MKGSQIVLGLYNGVEAAALLTDGTLEDLFIDSDAPRPGTLYRAKAIRAVKGQGGMFFETPDGNAFLRGAKGVAPGDIMLVQVSGYAEKGKAIPVTPRVLFKGRYAIVTPDAPGINISRAIRDEEKRVELRSAADTFSDDLRGCGIILRSAAETGPIEDVVADIGEHLNLAFSVLADNGSEIEKLFEGPGPEELAWREWPRSPIDREGLEDLVEAALMPAVQLPGAGSMVIEPTSAFVAVDINTGRDTSLAAGLKANLAAARDLPRALRVKGLGGQIVVDFAPMPKKDRRTVESILRAGFKADGIETALVGWTHMGLFEMNRKRARPALHEVMK